MVAHEFHSILEIDVTHYQQSIVLQLMIPDSMPRASARSLL